MKIFTVLIICLLLAFPVYIFADESSHQKAAEKLLDLMEIDEQADQSFQQIRDMQMRVFSQWAPAEPTEEETAVIQNHFDKMFKLMSDELSYSKLKKDYIELYVSTFSEDEINGMIDFYESPIGKKFIDKSPELTQKIMLIAEKAMKHMMPEIEQLSNEFNQAMEKLDDKTMEKNAE